MEKLVSENTFEAVDEYIYGQYKRAKVTVTANVQPDEVCLKEYKQQFLSGERTDVVLSYQKNKDIWYDESEIVLLDLKLELQMRKDLPDFIREQYLWAINEKIAKIRMLRETQATIKGEDVATHMRRFEKYADFIYGKPDLHIFNNVIQTIERDVERSLQASDTVSSAQREAKTRLLQTISEYKNIHPYIDEYAPAPVSKETEEIVGITDAEELKKVFEEAFVIYGLSDEWQAKIDSKGTRTAIAVAPAARKVYLPSSEKLAMRSKKGALTPKKVQALIAHEIGTHAVRAVNGERAQVKILGAGLDRYIQGEEGLATYREQQENPADDYAGLDGYFAIGLAKGLDDGTKKDFTQVFNRLIDYYLVTEETTEQKAKELAWNRCVRVFRGTTGSVPGVVFPKDLAYRQGNIAHWNAVKNESLSGIDLDSGKFDPTNPRHVAFLENLKKLNADVENLDTKDS